MRRTPVLVLALALSLCAALALSACGTSKEDQAKADVCKARDDIANQVLVLQNATAGGTTPTALKGALDAIGADLKKIKAASPDLSADRAAKVAKAKKQFESDLTQITTNFAKDFSVTDPQARLAKVSTAVALAYQTTFQQLDCK